MKVILFRAVTSFALLGALGLAARTAASGPQESLTTGATAARRQWAASLRWENDAFGGTDRFYTNGLSLAVSHSGPGWMDPVADLLPWGKGRRTVVYDLTQGMATPADIRRPVPDPADRPYAGALIAGLALHVERSSSYHGLKLMAGVVGPWSLAEETQRGVHRLVDGERPEGWDHQLDNEPVLNLAYEYRHRFRLAGNRAGWSVEALPSVGGMLGNLLTQGQVGGVLRFGYNMPDDFGLTLMRGMGHMPPPQRDRGPSGSRWGLAVHGGGVANFVARDLTLDGSTFEDSPSVDKSLFVPAAGVGISVGNRHLLTSLTYVFWDKDFEQQQKYSRFGAFAVSYLF